MKLIRDTWLIFRRSLILTLRQPVWVVFGLMQPVLYLVLFGPLLEGAIEGGRRRHERVQLVRARAASSRSRSSAPRSAGFGLIAELRYGVVERMRVTPMSRAAMLLGRSLRDVVILHVPGDRS